MRLPHSPRRSPSQNSWTAPRTLAGYARPSLHHSANVLWFDLSLGEVLAGGGQGKAAMLDSFGGDQAFGERTHFWLGSFDD
jgi:hypothetical protein